METITPAYVYDIFSIQGHVSMYFRKPTTSSENIEGSSSSLRYNNSGEVTDNRELNRRNAVIKTKFIVRIVVNGKQVLNLA